MYVNYLNSFFFNLYIFTKTKKILYSCKVYDYMNNVCSYFQMDESIMFILVGKIDWMQILIACMILDNKNNCYNIVNPINFFWCELYYLLLQNIQCKGQ